MDLANIGAKTNLLRQPNIITCSYQRRLYDLTLQNQEINYFTRTYQTENRTNMELLQMEQTCKTFSCQPNLLHLYVQIEKDILI